MDRSWIRNSKPGDREYDAGVRQFINFAVKNSGGREKLPCPCHKCHNLLHKRVDEILNHLTKFAFYNTYTCWIWHGEKMDETHVVKPKNNLFEEENVVEGVENNVREFARRVINEGIRKFCCSRKDKKFKKDPTIAWKKIQCPRQPEGTVDCGYYICRYMQEIIEKRRQVIPEKYFDGGLNTYSQEMVDKIRDSWITYVFKHNVIGDEEDDMEVVE
ncbi:Non-structural protein 4 [Bienertia sinuspersici]